MRRFIKFVFQNGTTVVLDTPPETFKQVTHIQQDTDKWILYDIDNNRVGEWTREYLKRVLEESPRSVTQSTRTL